MKKKIDDRMLGNALCSSMKAHQKDVLASFRKKSDGALKKRVSDEKLAELFDDFINNIFLWQGPYWLEQFSDKFRKIYLKDTGILQMYMLFTNTLFHSLTSIIRTNSSKIDKKELDVLYTKVNDINNAFIEHNNLQISSSAEQQEKTTQAAKNEVSNRDLKQIFDAITDPLFVVDSDMKLLRVNNFLLERLGVKSSKDVLGKKANTIKYEGNFLCQKVDFEEVFSEGQVKVAHIHLDAGEKYYIQYTYPMLGAGDDKEKVTAAFVYRKDLSAHKNMEEELQHLDRLATLGRLSSIVAHEIRNPLSGIGLSASLLRKKLSKDWQYIDSLDNILEGIDRIESVVLRLLDFSKPRKTEKRRVNVFDTLKEALFFIRPRANKRSIHIIEDYSESLPSVFVDPDQLTQVFINLFLNALQSIKDEGAIKIEITLEPDNSVIIKISDTGEGIKKDALPHIFEPFFTTKNDGTGLGLTISKNILMQNDIDISVESKVKKGTTFTLKVGAYNEI